MDLSNVDYGGLQQMLESAQIDHIFRQLDHLLRERLNASEKRQRLSEAAGAIQQTVKAVLASLPSDLGHTRLVTEPLDLKPHLQMLEKDCAALLRLIEDQLMIDLKLGARENSLVERVDSLRPLIKELASAVGLDVPMFTGSWTPSEDSEESDGETDSMVAELKSYYKILAVQGALEEQIAGIVIEKRRLSNTKHYSEEQNVLALDCNLSSRLKRLEQELLDSRKSSEQLRDACTALGIDVEQRRWRNSSHCKSSMLGKEEPPEARLRGWLDEIEGSELGIADQDVSYLPNSSEPWTVVRSQDLPFHEQHAGGASSLFESGQESKHNTLNTSGHDCNAQSLATPVVHGSSQDTRKVHAGASPESPATFNKSSTALVDLKDSQLHQEPNRPSYEILSSLNDQRGHEIPISRSSANATDPVLPSPNIGAESHRENKFRQRKPSFYSWGTVFKILDDSVEWNASHSTAHSIVTDNIVGVGRSGAPRVQQTLLFMVVDRTENYCNCLRIKTREGRGVSDLLPGEVKDDYSIVYTGKVAPKPTEEEINNSNDSGSLRKAIRIRPYQHWLKFSPLHRLHWTKTHAVPLDVKSAMFGKVHPHSKDMAHYYLEYRIKIPQPECVGRFNLLRECTGKELARPSMQAWRASGTAAEMASHRKASRPSMNSESASTLAKPMSTRYTNISKNKFERGNIIDLVIDRGIFSQERRCRRLLVNDVRHSNGKWQYRLQSTKHNGLYSEGSWIDESPWMVPAK